MVIAGPKPGSAASMLAAATPRIRLTMSADLSLTSAVATPIPWDTETFKSGLTHSVAVDNDEVTVVTAGLYAMTCAALFSLQGIDAPDGDGVLLQGRIVRSAVTISRRGVQLSTYRDASNNCFISQILTDLVELEVGDVIVFDALASFAGVGATADVVALSASRVETWLAIHRIGPVAV